MSTLPPAGWYDDPESAGGLRYWDGSVWTGHRHEPEATVAAVPAPVVGPAPESFVAQTPDAVTEPEPFVAETPEPEPEPDPEPVLAPVVMDPAPAFQPIEPFAEPVQVANAPSSPPPPPVPPPSVGAANPWSSPMVGPASVAPPAPPQWGAEAQAGVQWQPSPGRRVAGPAAASLICSLLWLFGVASLAAIPLGIMGRRAVADSGGTLDGTGMATTGIVLGALGVVLAVAIVLSL